MLNQRFQWSLLIADILMIALGLLVVLPEEPVLLATFFLGILIAVLTAGSPGWAIGGIASAGLYLAVISGLEGGAIRIDGDLLLRTVFLVSSGYYFLFSIRIMNRTAGALHSIRRESLQLRALLKITEAISSSLETRTVMQRIVRQVGSMVDSMNCSILLCDQAFKDGFVVASDQDPGADRLKISLADYPELREALVTGEMVIVEDASSDPIVHDVRDILQAKGYRSMLILPLLFGREVLGTLYLRYNREQAFSEQEIRFCRAAAGASANALKNAMLYEEVRNESRLLRSTSEKLRRLLDCSPDLIVATDPEGRITEFNRSAVALTGLTEEEARGRLFHAVLGQDESPWEEDEAGIQERNLVVRNHEGEEREFNLVSAPLVGKEGKSAGRVWIGRDVTHLNRVERSLAQAERLSTLGEVVAGVAHELNNPLSSVLGYSELARKNSENPALLRDLGRVVDSARRCKKIVQNLLGFARKNNAEKKYADLNACIRRVLDLRAYNLRAIHVSVVEDLAEKLPSTLFDFQQIEQVIMNLVANAEQALSRIDRERVLAIRSWAEDGRIHMEVRDSGPGIAPEHRARVFDPFFTTKGVGQGTGLGLSVSFGIVREHDGVLGLGPEQPGGGACFRMSLPVVPMPAANANEETEGSDRYERQFQGRKILVAEDEPLVLELFSRVLENDGAQVTRAVDGREAWEQLEEGEFDLVVADLRMPRMDGQELYERVALERPEMLRRFVFSTGDMASENTLTFLGGLPNGILVKPLQVETVRHVLGKALAQSR